MAHTVYGLPRYVNLGLVGYQQNEYSALHNKQENMHPFRKRFMFAVYSPSVFENCIEHFEKFSHLYS